MAKRLHFLRAFDARPHPKIVVAYPSGWRGLVPNGNAAAALAAGAAIEVKLGELDESRQSAGKNEGAVARD